MSRFATIDVGSNSALIHIAQRAAGGAFEVLADRAELSRLGEGLAESGEFSAAAMDRTLTALGEFMDLARQHEVGEIAAVGTMALRNAKNAPLFLQRVKDELGLQIEVIPGEEEARLSYMAARSALPQAEHVVIFDVGGGSTEFIFGAGAQIAHKQSLDVGALRLTEQYLKSDPVSADELGALMAKLGEDFAAIGAKASESKVEGLVGMGGAITNMAAVKHQMTKYDPSLIQGSELDTDEMERQLELYRQKPIAERREISGLQPKRADTILAGAAIVTAVMRRLGMKQLVVSDRGIRHGLMVDRFAAE